MTAIVPSGAGAVMASRHEPWVFDPLPLFSFDVIIIDPPWSYERWSDTNQTKGAADQYETMELADICRLPVGHLAAGNCLVLLWGCGCMLPQALTVLKSWGFAFKSEIIWRKITKNGKPRMGVGYRVRTMHEPILLATNGSPDHPAFPSLFDGIAREHSRKPDEFYDIVRAKTPGMRRADLFSRETRPGFNGWGNESTKFDLEPPRLPRVADSLGGAIRHAAEEPENPGFATPNPSEPQTEQQT